MGKPYKNMDAQFWAGTRFVLQPLPWLSPFGANVPLAEDSSNAAVAKLATCCVSVVPWVDPFILAATCARYRALNLASALVVMLLYMP